jgi:hypothetical protein
VPCEKAQQSRIRCGLRLCCGRSMADDSVQGERMRESRWVLKAPSRGSEYPAFRQLHDLPMHRRHVEPMLRHQRERGVAYVS